ncbi:MAG: hypothetical protein ACRYFX_19810 [Janthinobacterium lividum]
MVLRPYSLLAPALLLTSLLACSKKQEEVTPAEVKNTASYNYDGQVVSCIAKQAAIASQAPGYDYLRVTMTTSPAPSSGPEYLQLAFRRPTGQPATTYLPVSESTVLYNSANPQGLTFQFLLANRTFEESGSVSGTFYGEARTLVPGGTYTVAHTLSSGTFTNVQP